MAWNNNYNNRYNNNRYNNRQNRYTKSEKISYYSGMGYAVAHNDSMIDFKSQKCKDSFKAGYKKGKEMIEKNPQKYQKLPSNKKK